MDLVLIRMPLRNLFQIQVFRSNSSCNIYFLILFHITENASHHKTKPKLKYGFTEFSWNRKKCCFLNVLRTSIYHFLWSSDCQHDVRLIIKKEIFARVQNIFKRFAPKPVPTSYCYHLYLEELRRMCTNNDRDVSYHFFQQQFRVYKLSAAIYLTTKFRVDKLQTSLFLVHFHLSHYRHPGFIANVSEGKVLHAPYVLARHPGKRIDSWSL